GQYVRAVAPWARRARLISVAASSFAAAEDFGSLTRHQASAASASPVASRSTARRSLFSASGKSRFFSRTSPIFKAMAPSSLRAPADEEVSEPSYLVRAAG